MENYHYGIIGNCSTAALVSKDGSIDWLCLPYFDSPSLFAKILDDQEGGFFNIEAVDCIESRQEYILHTAILKTIFETKQGSFEVCDYIGQSVIKESRHLQAGRQIININMDHAGPGVHILSVKSDKGHFGVRKILKSSN